MAARELSYTSNYALTVCFPKKTLAAMRMPGGQSVAQKPQLAILCIGAYSRQAGATSAVHYRCMWLLPPSLWIVDVSCTYMSTVVVVLGLAVLTVRD